MNGFQATQFPISDLLTKSLLPWLPTSYFRPVGGLWYRLLLDRFGWDPPLFHKVAHMSVILWMVCFYGAAVAISRNHLTASLAVALIAYHSGLSHLYYGTGFCYDWLTSIFWLLSLTTYLIGRRKLQSAQNENRRFLEPWILLLPLTLLLYFFALSSKEIAVSLPIMIILYDLLDWWHSDERKFLSRPVHGFLPWKFVLPVWLALIASTLAFIRFRIYKTEGLGQVGSYQLQVSWQKYVENGRDLLHKMLQMGDSERSQIYLIGFVTLLIVALLFGKQNFRWAALFCLIGVLPIAFIPQRDLPQALLVLFGPALLLSMAVTKLVSWTRIDRHPILAFILFAFVLDKVTAHMVRFSPPPDLMLSEGKFMQQVAESMNKQLPRPWKRDAKVICFHQPFGHFNWATTFMTGLLAQDPFLSVTNAADGSDTTGFDYAITFTPNGVASIQTLSPAAKVVIGSANGAVR
jgi:hypothetical protein